MIYTVEKSLAYFEFWSGAKVNAEQLTFDELEQLDDLLPELFGEEPPTDTQINDLFWFDFKTVADLLGYKLDDSGDIIRDDDEDED